jgi:hypothetical protein
MSMPSWNMAKTMSQADGAGLKQIIAAADDAMPPGMHGYLSEHMEQG